MPRTEREIVIDAPMAAVYAVITDYERYPDFLPEMREVRVLGQDERGKVVHFELELIMRLSYSLRITERPPSAITWTLEDAKMIAANVGGWTLSASGERQTLARYALDVKLRGLIPKSVSDRLLGTTLPETLTRFKGRAEAVWQQNPQGA
mgnify:CR=1 FL=1